MKSTERLTLVVEGRAEEASVALPRIVLEGLDGRSVEVELEPVEVSLEERREIEIDLRAMPLQGISHSVTLTGAVEFVGHGEDAVVTVRTEPRAFHFSEGYEEVFVYDLNTMITEFSGGTLAEDPRTIRGRIDVGEGFVEVADLLAEELQEQAQWLDEDPDDVVPPNVGGIEFTYEFPDPEVGEEQQMAGGGDLGFGATLDPAAAPGPNPPGPTPDNPPPTFECLYLNPWDCCVGDDCIDVCADWSTDFVDASSYGAQMEDYAVGSYSQTVDASYAAYEISQKKCSGQFCWIDNVDAGRLGPDGCAKVDLPPGSGYAIRLTTELRHGSAGHTYPVHYYTENANEAGVGLVKVSKGFNRYPDGLAVPPLPPSLTMTFHPATNAAATISRVLVSGALSGQSSGFLTMAGLGCLGYEDAGIPPTDACAGNVLKTGPYTNPGGAPGDLRWKFVAAHEAGHVAQRKGMGIPANAYCFTPDGSVTGDCENNEPDPALAPESCRCDHVTGSNRLHCLQSIEHTTAAQVEGWAQFFAARVWNDADGGCTFNYYKQFREDDGTIVQPPYKVACDSNVNWRDNHCYVGSGGTEYDWLQFFWNLHAVGSYKYSTLDIFNVYGSACGGSCEGAWLSWSELSSAALSLFTSGKHAVFVVDGDITGVDEDKY